MSAFAPRFDVTADQILAVVAAFYATVRADPVLAPVFAAHVRDWPAHEAKIAGFWRNAILLDRSYDGNPMAVHRAASGVSGDMFVPWLAAFDATLTRSLPPLPAQAWSQLAHRIGRGLRLGLGDGAGPPVF